MLLLNDVLIPISFKISINKNTSDILGILCKVTVSSHNILAAIIGRLLFLEPLILIEVFLYSFNFTLAFNVSPINIMKKIKYYANKTFKKEKNVII